MDVFTEVLKEMPAIPGEKTDSLADRLERILKERFGEKDKN